MTTMHTPGPWEVAGQYVRTKRRPDDMAGMMVADCGNFTPATGANARLIAAAPDLVDTIRSLFEVLEGVDFADDNDLVAVRSACVLAQSVLTKAGV